MGAQGSRVKYSLTGAAPTSGDLFTFHVMDTGTNNSDSNVLFVQL